MWENEEAQKISRNKRKICSIRLNFDLYQVCLSYIIYFPIFLFYDYTNTLSPRHICGISITRGKEFRKYWPKWFKSEEGKVHMNGGGRSC